MTPGEIFRHIAPMSVGCWSLLALMTVGALGLDGERWTVTLIVAWTILYPIPAYLYFKIARQFKKATECRSAETYLRDLANPAKGICLLLRPFGADSSIRLLSNKEFFTVEGAVAQAVRDCLGCETVALVDSRTTFCLKVPEYIVTDDESWRRTVLDLLEVAAVVVLLLPPGQLARSNVRWELSVLLQSGLSERLVILLPTPYFPGYHQALRSLHQYDGLFPGLSQVPDGVFMVLPNVQGELKFSHLPMVAKQYLDRIARGQAHTYIAALNIALDDIGALGSGAREVHRTTNITEADTEAFAYAGSAQCVGTRIQSSPAGRMKIRPNTPLLIMWLASLCFFAFDGYCISSLGDYRALHEPSQVTTTKAEVVDTWIDSKQRYYVKYRFKVPGSDLWYSSADGGRQDLWAEVYPLEWRRLRGNPGSILVQYVKTNPWANSPLGGPGSKLADLLALTVLVLAMNICSVIGAYHITADFIRLRRQGEAFAPRGVSFWYGIWDKPSDRS